MQPVEQEVITNIKSESQRIKKNSNSNNQNRKQKLSCEKSKIE